MGEDKLDKIVRLCYWINKNKGINVSFQVGYWYSGVSPSVSLHIDGGMYQYVNVDAAIDALENLYTSDESCKLKTDLLDRISHLQYELNKYWETLAKLEEK